MERKERTRLDDLLAREPAATLRILDDVVDVEQRLKELYRRVGVDRAAEIFEETTRPLTDPADQTGGWTLHQLRHSMLTHEAENGTSTPTLLARSRHTSVRALASYARPGPEAIAAHVAATGPAARRRRPPGTSR